jgi:hypothetical protein
MIWCFFFRLLVIKILSSMGILSTVRGKKDGIDGDLNEEHEDSMFQAER